MTSERSVDWSRLAWSFFFLTRAYALPTKSHTRLYPFDKPIKSFYFCSFVVSVLFVLFHFKVIRKSLYLISERHAMPVPVRTFTNWIPWFFLLSTACTSAVVTLILYTFFHLLWHFRYVFDRRFYNDSELPQSIRVPSYFRIKVNHQKTFLKTIDSQ